MSTLSIPKKDADFLAWGNNFAALLTANPTTYGITAPQALIIQTAADQFQTAYDVANAPSTRTLVTVAAKDAARTYAFTIYSSYYAIIKANPAVASSDKNDLGIRYPNDPPSPIPPPATPVLLTLQQQIHLGATVRYADATTPDKRAKPAGVAGMLLFRTVAVGISTDPDQALLVGYFTKQPILMSFISEEVGKTCTMWARWTNRTGQEGPWSAAVSFVVT